MSFPDPTLPPHTLTSPPLGGGIVEGGGVFWPPFMIGNDQPHHQNHQSQHPDSIPQFDHHNHHHNHHTLHQNPNHNPPPFKRSRPSDKPLNYPQINPRTNPPNLPGNRGTTHIFYKTRICAKFMEGTCRNGDNCTFAHGADDLREPPPNWQDLIREKERGAGSGGWGEDRVHRMKICKKYYNGEECPYGDKCNFLHERPPHTPVKKFKADVLPIPVHRDRESAAISIGTLGDHREIAGSGDQAVFWKTKLCSKWEIGQCPFGDRCHYAHGQSDLKLDELEKAATAIPRKPTGFVQGSSVPAPNVMVGGGSTTVDGGKETKFSKWKLTKKVNRIYADWLDDMSPPRDLPNGDM